MTDTQLDIILDGPPPMRREGEIRNCFTKGHNKKGFDLLRIHLDESHQLHIFTVYHIINSFVVDERLALLKVLRANFYASRTPKVLINYLNIIRQIFRNNKTKIKPRIKNLINQQFPFELLAMNFYTNSHFHLVSYLAKKKEHLNNIKFLEILMKSYMGLLKWQLSEETANHILLIDSRNISAICVLARLSILDGDYSNALNILKDAEKNDLFITQDQSIKDSLINYVDELIKINLSEEHPEDILLDQSTHNHKVSSASKELNLKSGLIINKKLDTFDANILRQKIPFNKFNRLIINNNPTPNIINGHSYRTFWLSSDLIKDPIPIRISAEQHTLLYFLALELKQRSTKNNSYWMTHPYNHMKELVQAFKSINVDLKDILLLHIEKHKKRYKDMTDGYSEKDLIDREMLFYRMVISKWPFEHGNFIRRRHVSIINSEVKKTLNVENWS